MVFTGLGSNLVHLICQLCLVYLFSLLPLTVVYTSPLITIFHNINKKSVFPFFIYLQAKSPSVGADFGLLNLHICMCCQLYCLCSIISVLSSFNVLFLIFLFHRCAPSSWVKTSHLKRWSWNTTFKITHKVNIDALLGYVRWMKANHESRGLMLKLYYSSYHTPNQLFSSGISFMLIP